MSLCISIHVPVLKCNPNSVQSSDRTQPSAVSDNHEDGGYSADDDMDYAYPVVRRQSVPSERKRYVPPGFSALHPEAEDLFEICLEDFTEELQQDEVAAPDAARVLQPLLDLPHVEERQPVSSSNEGLVHPLLNMLNAPIFEAGTDNSIREKARKSSNQGTSVVLFLFYHPATDPFSL